MSNRLTKASLLAGTIMVGAVVSTPALAQDVVENEPALQATPAAEPEGEYIVVTGSRIQRRNVESSAPVAVVSDEEFSLSGTVNVENVINTLPQVVPGTTAFSNNPGNGTATLNLRGLGEARTLVLVNGRRWMSFDVSQVVDLNTIPAFLIDSVDVVTGGAGAVYGSDALAGVVNFRLRNVQGLEVGGQYSLTSRGDGARYNLNAALGSEFADGRGNATVFAEYYNRKSLFQGDRKFSNFALGGETFDAPLQQFGSSTIPNLRFNAPGSVAIDGSDDPATLPLGEGTVLDDAVFNSPGVASPRMGDLYNYAPVNYLMLPQERYLIGGYGDYEIGDGHTAYSEVTYVNNRVDSALAATPVTGTYLVDIETASQFVDADTLAALQQLDANETAANAARLAAGLSAIDGAAPGVVSASLQRRVIETGLRENLDERNAFRLVGGLRGPINDYVSYDAYYMYARTRNAQVQQGNISRSLFQAGLDGSGTPINIYGLNTLTPDMVDAISIQAQNGDVSSVQVASGVVNGTFGDFALGAAEPAGFAVGAEYRKVSSQFIPDTALSSGDVIGFNAGDATEGSYNVKEVFGELVVPFETDSGMRFVVEGKGRYSDYSLEAVGGVWSYAGGVEFAPIRDIKFRGQYQRAVRAPNVAELFGGQSIGFPQATDPCFSQAYLDANPGAAAVCTATGVPAGNLGNPAFQLNPQIPALFGGNPELAEETSESWTAGVVLQPSFLPGLTVTADYFNIVIEDAISSISLPVGFDLCYGQVQDASSPLCATYFNRNAEGSFDVENTPLVSTANIAELGVSGVDVEFDYVTTMPFSLLTDAGESDFNVSFLGTWTDKAYFEPIAGQDRVECAGQFGLNCGEPTPEYKFTSRFSLIDGPLTTSVRWRFLSGVRDDEPSVDFADYNGTERIGDYSMIDLTLAYAVNETFDLTFGVNNLFDNLPGTPQFDEDGIVTNSPKDLLGDNQEQANTYPSTYDVLGRDFFVAATMKF